MRIANLICSGFLALTMGAHADNLYAPGENKGNIVDVILLNNSGHTLVFQKSISGNSYSQCEVISGSTTLASGAYMAIQGTYNGGEGEGVSCDITFEDTNNTHNILYLEVLDPTYAYQGAHEYRFYDGGTQISSNYAPAPYPSNDPWALVDEDVSLVLNNY